MRPFGLGAAELPGSEPEQRHPRSTRQPDGRAGRACVAHVALRDPQIPSIIRSTMISSPRQSKRDPPDDLGQHAGFPSMSRVAQSPPVSLRFGASFGKPPDVAVEVTRWLSQQDAPCGIHENSTYAGFLPLKTHPSGHHQRSGAALHGASDFSYITEPVTNPRGLLRHGELDAEMLAQRNGPPNSSKSPLRVTPSRVAAV